MVRLGRVCGAENQSPAPGAHDLRGLCRRRNSQTVRLTPERVREDSNAAACGPHVLDLACCNPVVDRAAADADHLARFHDANRLALHWLSYASKETYRPHFTVD